MANNKIGRIVRDIQYIEPKGALKEFKYGVKISGAPRPIGSTSSTDSDFIEVDIKPLQAEMKKPPKPVRISDPELIDG